MQIMGTIFLKNYESMIFVLFSLCDGRGEAGKATREKYAML
jgi:hypothetical protein